MATILRPLVCAPLALHDATLTDFAPDHSLVAALRMAGLRNVFVTDWRSASPEMRFFSIDSYLASCIAAELSPDFQHLSAVGSVVQRGGCGAPGAAARRHARLIRAPIPRISQPALPDVRARLKRTALLAKPMNGINAPQRPDCVADDAVSCEPVSAPNSLLTGKLTGNFAKSGSLSRFLSPRRANSMAYSGIPYAT